MQGQSKARGIEHSGIIIHQENDAFPVRFASSFSFIRPGRCQQNFTQRKFEGERSAFSNLGFHRYLEAQRGSDTLGNREAKAQPGIGLLRIAANLIKFVEYLAQLVLGYSNTCIPYLYAEIGTDQRSGDRYAAFFREIDRIADQVHQDLTEQVRVGPDDPVMDLDNQFQTFVLRMRLAARTHLFDCFEQVDITDLRLHCVSVQLGDIKQGIEQISHILERGTLFADQIEKLGIICFQLKCFGQHGKRLQRLAQIVARRGEKSRFRRESRFGPLLRFLNSMHGTQMVANIPDRGANHFAAFQRHRAQADFDRHFLAVLQQCTQFQARTHRTDLGVFHIFLAMSLMPLAKRLRKQLLHIHPDKFGPIISEEVKRL